MTLEITSTAGGVQFAVKVVPGAARDRVVGLLGAALKVQVSAPPEDGRANARLCEVLADALSVPRRMVSVRSGHGSPHKIVVVTGLAADDLRTRLRLTAP